ncbi:MAG TPA: FHA domain-containing protein [Actinophytocola sp.]|uniref:FHA domain-containing protein n=1 Tax=Actinophytocola sp. TaxID=1872138 RepID=UPI002DDD6FB2|nr:FHA domain-containing protein [Actinophytocola sp.]HEV2780930.1 FHA domain-containing protein [Actinophytocola sp.]
MSVTVHAEMDKYVLQIGHEFSFGRSTQCTHCLAPDDAAISRTAGIIRSDNGTWFLVNVSSTRMLEVVDTHGIRSVLAPGRKFALEGRMRVLVQGSRPKPYLLRVDAPERRTPQVELPVDGVPTTIGQDVTITQQDRLALIALFAGYLEEGDRYDPHPRSYEAAAKRLGWARTTLVKRIEYLRSRLDKAGVPAMTGPNALSNLAEYALTSRLINSGDLRLLPGR